MSERIVGRAAELQQVGELIADETAEARALVLTGDAGVGKTTIWEEGVRLAGERGLRVLAARPAEGEAALPFAGLGDLLGPVVDAIELPRPQRIALERALQRADADEPADRLAVSRAALGLLQGLARDGPLVVAIDDVQWLDTPTEHVLAFALRRLADAPARVLLARRRGAGSPPFGLQRAMEVAIDPLRVGELGVLLRDQLELDLPRPRLLELHRACGGNPFYALEIGRALLREPRPVGPLPVPDSLGELLRLRLETLSAGAREAALLTAASTQPTWTLIERAAGGTGGLADAVDAGVLRVDGDRVRFSHPLHASIAYGSAAPWDRRSAHQRLAEVAPDADERAQQLAVAVEEPDERAASELELAAAAAAGRGAPETAARLAERAAELTPAGHESHRRRRLAVAAEHHIASGDPGRARAILDSLVAALPAGPERARLLLATRGHGRRPGRIDPPVRARAGRGRGRPGPVGRDPYRARSVHLDCGRARSLGGPHPRGRAVRGAGRRRIAARDLARRGLPRRRGARLHVPARGNGPCACARGSARQLPDVPAAELPARRDPDVHG